MYSREKIKQVINAIKENGGISAFDDDSLAKLLSILTPEEFEILKQEAYEEFKDFITTKRIMDIESKVNLLTSHDLYRIRFSDFYLKFIESIKSNEYQNYIKTLSDEQLGDLKKYLTYTLQNNDEYYKSGSKKLVSLIMRERKKRDKFRKQQIAA